MRRSGTTDPDPEAPSPLQRKQKLAKKDVSLRTPQQGESVKTRQEKSKTKQKQKKNDGRALHE